jgi:hypothetical protein
MGTRHLTVFGEEDGAEIVVMYGQWDGYPTGHGANLKEFLAGFAVTNGYGIPAPARTANGMSCLAAQTIAHFKEGIGSFYLYPAGTRDCGEEYVYTLSQREGRVHLRVQAGAVTFFGLPGTKQGNMPVIFDGFVDDFDPAEAERLWREWPYDVPNDFTDGQQGEGGE